MAENGWIGGLHRQPEVGVVIYLLIYVAEPCTTTYVGDRYLVHPVQVRVPMIYWIIPGTRLMSNTWHQVRVVTRYQVVPGKNFYFIPIVRR